MSWVQGFLLGQLSVVLLIGAFIKFFIFGEAPSQSRKSVRTTHTKHIRTSSISFISKSPSQSLRKKPSSSGVLRPIPTTATDIASILRKTYYQIPLRGSGKHSHTTHQPESLDWFNVLLAQTIAQYRQTAYNLKDLSPDRPSILTSLSNAINEPAKKPAWIDTIKITEISFGEEYPIFSNVRVVAIEDDSSTATGGRLQALMDVDLSDDNLTLGIETNLLVNYPKPRSAVLPVALSVSIVRFSATLSISFVPAAQDLPKPGETAIPSSKPKTNLAFSFLPDYRLDLSVRSLLGSRSRLQDVPKVAQLIEARVHAWFEERVVEPRVQVVPLPGIWPRMGKTRVREGQEDDRPTSQDGSKTSTGSNPRTERKSNHFPSQEEAEALIQGLRFRSSGANRRNSEVLVDEDDYRRSMPGSLSG